MEGESSIALLDREKQEEEKKEQRIRYKEFKKFAADDISVGTIVVENVNPMKLWASQDWVDAEKIKRLDEPGDASQSDSTKNIVVPAYYYDMPVTGQRAMIIADAHHRTLRAQENGDRVDVKIIGPMPDGLVSIPFSKFRRIAGKPF